MPHLLDLPREIRDHIYNYAWEGAAFVLQAKKLINTDAVYSQYKEPEAYAAVGLPMWLRTNKAFMQEGLEQFQRKGYLKYPGSRYRGTRKTRKPKAFSTLLSPISSRELHVTCGTIQENFHKMARDEEMVWCTHCINRQDINYLASLMKDVAATCTTKVLDINLVVNIKPYRNPELDLSDLVPAIVPAIQLLNRLVLRIIFPLREPRPWNTLGLMMLEMVKDLDKKVLEWVRDLDEVLIGMTSNVGEDMVSPSWEYDPVVSGAWVVVWTRG